MEPSREPFASLLLYYLFKWSVVSPALYTYFQGRVYGAELVPNDGKLVVVSNHASVFDPPLLACAVRRPVAFMAKEELFHVPVLKHGIKLYGAYPVKRGASDRSALKAAINSLDQGWATGVFLQGTRSPDGKITDPKLGAALIAAMSNSPILPISLWGTEKILQKGSVPQPVPITIRIGQVIPPPESTKREALETVTQECANVINGLHSLGR
jgi:1-acyl-sn-glycerol-3-phosphate acyltransferase